MKWFYCLLLLLIWQSGSAQLTKREAQDTVIWRADSLLNRSYFLAKRSHYGPSIPAYITSAIYLYQKENNGIRMFYVEAIMLKSKSFMKEETPYILNHEQMHFNITEIYARRLRKMIAEKDFTKVTDVVSLIERMYAKTMNECQKREAAYDKDTQHGINAAKQEVWNQTILKELLELDAFASTEVNVVR